MTIAPLSEASLAEIRAREAAATPGHWGTHYDGQGTYSIEAQPRLIPGHGNTSEGLIATIREADDDPAQAYRNAEFIARGRTDFHTLLNEVDRLRARVAELADHAGPDRHAEGK